MNKAEIFEQLESFGNGHFLEEVDDSYNPSSSLIRILDQISMYIMLGVREHPMLSDWSHIAAALRAAKDVFEKEELDKILRHEFNLDPVAVGGSAEFLDYLSTQLTTFINKAQATWNQSDFV